MKKFFSLCILLIFCCFSTFSLSGCKKNEIEKQSKDLSSYAISAEFNDELKQISATETIVFYNNTDEELEYLCLHLYPRAFREGAIIKPYTQLTSATCFPNGINFGDLVVLKVRVNADTKDFELIGEDEDILKINFGFKLTKRKSVQIEIVFNLIIPNSTHRFGWFENNVNLGNWYPIVCAYENGEFDLSPYYATGDPFNSSLANYDVEFKYPAKYQLASTGEIKLEKNGEINTSKITAKAVRDFAMCLSADSKITQTTAGKTQVFYMAENVEENIEKYAEISKKAVEYFSAVFGKYPYSTLSVVKTPFIYGGMEYPNIVFISNSIDSEEEILKVIVHEIAHQWWYAVVGNNEVKEAWLDESLAEYSTALFFEANEEYGLTYDEFVNEALSSYLLYVDVIQTLRGDVNTKMNLAVNEYQNDYEYSYMVYVKGVIMFDSLKNMVGEKKLIDGLKKYYDDNKFKVATCDDFFKAFDEACHKDLRTYFDGFLNGTTIISSL
ncbi:MAG: M1 family metallopeptidase [Clostridia bacterium]|nr:M1 family metallopeptidase [Clostridia bacterium]